MVFGSADWLVAHRNGAFANRPPVPWEPPPKKMPVNERRGVWHQAINSPVPTTLIAYRNGAFVPVPYKPLPPDEVVSSKGKLVPLAEHHGEFCPYCGKLMMFGTPRVPTRDHVYPRSLGGTLAESNRLIVCRPCNHDKSNMTLEQFARRLEAKRDERTPLIWALALRYCGPHR